MALCHDMQDMLHNTVICLENVKVYKNCTQGVWWLQRGVSFVLNLSKYRLLRLTTVKYSLTHTLVGTWWNYRLLRLTTVKYSLTHTLVGTWWNYRLLRLTTVKYSLTHTLVGTWSNYRLLRLTTADENEIPFSAENENESHLCLYHRT